MQPADPRLAWFQNNVRVDAIHRLFRLSTNRQQMSSKDTDVSHDPAAFRPC